MKKYLIIALCSVAILVSVGAYQVRASMPNNTSDDVSGWLWSPNIGWISMSHDFLGSTGGANHVKLISDTTNPEISLFSGYAWAPNLGWLSFNQNDVNDCPSTPEDLLANGAVGNAGSNSNPSCNPRVHMTGNTSEKGKVSGWARFLTLKDTPSGGWVHLSGAGHLTKQTPVIKGVTYDTDSKVFSGYAWSPDIGFISFQALGPGSTPKTLSVNLTATPNSGSAPSFQASLSATLGGTATGMAQYEFSCDGTNYDTPVSSPQNSLTRTTLCTYTGGPNPVPYSPNVRVTRESVVANATAGVVVNPATSALDLKIKRTTMANFIDTPISIKKGESFMLKLVNASATGCTESVTKLPSTNVTNTTFNGSDSGTSWSFTADPGNPSQVFTDGTPRTITIPTSKTTSLATGRYEIKISCTTPASTDQVLLNVGNSTVIEI